MTHLLSKEGQEAVEAVEAAEMEVEVVVGEDHPSEDRDGEDPQEDRVGDHQGPVLSFLQLEITSCSETCQGSLMETRLKHANSSENGTDIEA